LSKLILSWRFVVQSLKFLSNNKDLLIFPIVSVIACLLFLALTVGAGVIELPLIEHVTQTQKYILIATLLLIYLLLSYIIIFFNACLLACATLRLQGQQASKWDGVKLAAQHKGQIFNWSLISTTVGYIIHSLENSHGFIREIIGYILGFTWAIGSYFVIPVLIFENIGPFQALKRSYQIFGRGWRKMVSVNLFSFLLMAAILGLWGLALYSAPQLPASMIENSVIALILIFIGLLIINNAFNQIIRGALYISIIQNQTPVGYDEHLLKQSFQKRD